MLKLGEPIRTCIDALAAIKLRQFTAARTFSLILVMMSGALAAPQNDNLPVFTSPIDVTGFPVQLHAVAPDPNSGKPVEVALPVGLLGPKMNQLFVTPLSSQFDQNWAVTRDPKTNMTPRDQACSGPNGITSQVQQNVQKIGSGFNAYDISCNLASTGKLLAKQVGSTLYLGYLLTNNKVDFAVTTPVTCHPGHGTPVCPNDPRFSVTFALEIVTVLHTAGFCQLSAENGTAVTQNVNIDGSQNLAGSLASLADDLFLGHKFSAAERAIENTQKQVPLPLDGDFQELRNSDGCTGKNELTSRTLKEFSDFGVVIQAPPPAIIVRLTHPAITPPTVVVSSSDPSGPTLWGPSIATNRPVAQVGSSLEVNGRYFPPSLNLSTALPVSLGHGAPNSIILGGPCFGGGTDLQWGPAAGPLHVQRLPGTTQATCSGSYNAVNLAPSTTYQFSARDCDAFTCSLWSAPVKVTTAVANPDKGKVVLTLDGTNALGTATVTAGGTFDITVTIPRNASSGNHKVRAVDGTAVAEAAIVISAASSGAKASMMMVGVLNGESGCPNHPITSTQTDAPFMLFGSGFPAGSIAIHLDAPAGLALGTAVAQADGSFCQKMTGVPGSQAGNHTLVAVQNGSVDTQMAVTFVLPSLVH